MLQRCLRPVYSDHSPGLAKPFFIGISILRNYRRDPIGMSHRETESSWRSIIENIQCKSLDLERLSERIERSGQPVERIDVFSFCGDFCEPKTREVRRDHVVVAREM